MYLPSCGSHDLGPHGLQVAAHESEFRRLEAAARQARVVAGRVSGYSDASAADGPDAAVVA